MPTWVHQMKFVNYRNTQWHYRIRLGIEVKYV